MENISNNDLTSFNGGHELPYCDGMEAGQDFLEGLKSFGKWLHDAFFYNSMFED